MKKILFERSGGFMGRKISLDIDFDGLPDEKAEHLNNLLDEADFFELPNDLTRKDMPDAFTYSITVVSNKGEYSVRCGDTTAPNDLRPLLDELNKQARMHR